MPYAIPLQSLTEITVTTFRVAYITAKLINLSQHNNRTTLFLHPHSPTTPPWHNTNCQFITPHTKSRDAKSCVSQAINGDYNMPIITGINCAIFLGRRKILRLYRHTPLWWNNIYSHYITPYTAQYDGIFHPPKHTSMLIWATLTPARATRFWMNIHTPR